MQKTIITCDHCKKEVPNTYSDHFQATFLFAAKRGCVDACSDEHLGFALAKAFGIPIDGNLAPILAAKDARNLCLENDLKLAQRRITELESTLYNVETQHNDARAKVATLEQRLAEQSAPVDATGKTPGEVSVEARRAATLSRGVPFYQHHVHNGQDIDNDAIENEAAQAVLRAFGGADALRRVLNKIDMASYAPNDDDDHVVNLQYAIDVIDEEIASITDTKRPTKPGEE